MVDPLILNRKLQRLASYLGELEEMSGLTLEDYLSDFRHRRAVERLIQVIVDVSVDINTHAVVDADVSHRLTPIHLFSQQRKSASFLSNWPGSLRLQLENETLSFMSMKLSMIQLFLKA